MPLSSVAPNSASVSSIARRSTARLNAAMSVTQIVDAKHPVSGFGELLESRLRLRQECGRSSELRNALLEQRERCVEVQLVVLQARRDRLQALHAGFEGHDSAPATAPGVVVD